MPSLFSRFKRRSKDGKSAPSSPTPSSHSTAQTPPASPARPQTHTASPQIRGHVSQAPPSDHPRPSLDVDDIPPRSTSLNEPAVNITPHSEQRDPRLSSSATASNTEMASGMQNMQLDAPPQLPPLHLHNDSLATTFTAVSAPTIPKDPSAPSLEVQRDQLVNKIATAAKARKAEHGELSEAGRAAFQAAGMDKEANTKGSLEVETRYLKPVVQETIIIKEHTETTTIIDQHIHRHHVYPKIQPISDPNPIKLEPRHRIFSAADGKWHEVVGDAAAIAILGEDVFYNGKKEVREERKMALPGLGGEVDERAFEARVVEREGIKGEMGSWHQLKGIASAETPSAMVGEGWMLPEDQMGPAEKTVGIAL